MKTSQIKFLVTLDKDKIPEKITWNAEDSMGNEFSETKSFPLSSRISTLPLVNLVNFSWVLLLLHETILIRDKNNN